VCGIGNKQQKQSQARDRNLKPSQVAPDQDGAVICERAEIFRKIGHSAATHAGRQVLKTRAATEGDAEAKFLDPQTKLSLFIQGCAGRECLIKSACCLQHRAPNRKIATGDVLD